MVRATNNRRYSREAVVDLEAEFSPSLLNSAVFLLQLIQQVSTFAINYQGRPFREALSENKGMWYGIVGVTAIAFACSTEFVPEINAQMKLVPFTHEFKVTMTAIMVIDYAACYLIEIVLKRLFSDYRPRDIAERRPDQLEREVARRNAAIQKRVEEAERKENQAEQEKIAAFERNIRAQQQRLNAHRDGRQQ